MSDDVAIRVEGLGKRYKLGTVRKAYSLLSENIGEFVNNRLFGRGKDSPETEEEDEYLWALRDVSFEVKRGEVLGVIGRNGAGKSTLLKVLSRITTPTEGKVEIRGRVGSLLEVGTGFHPELTGRENIFLNGSILGMSRREIKSRFDEIIDFAGIDEKFLDTPVKRYSSGMYVRLGFAVAAHFQPEILLVDEVLAVGDYTFQKKCLGKMEEISKTGRTVLFISHNMATIRNLCTRCVLISNGRIVMSGDPDDVISQYLISSFESNKNEVLENKDLGIRLESLEFVNRNGLYREGGVSGDPCIIKLIFRCYSPHDDVLLSLSVNDPFLQRICLFHSKIAGVNLSLRPPLTTVQIEIPRLYLFPDSYSLDLKMMVGTKTVLLRSPVKQFPIFAGDFFKTGKLPQKAWNGPVLIDQKWSCLLENTREKEQR